MAKEAMIALAQELFPLNRSLTGHGVRDSLEILNRDHPELVIRRFHSGQQVFDWQIPKQWEIKDAYIEHVESGQRFAEFVKLNLHVVGYSEPVNKVMPLDQLKSRIFTQPEQPEWVPYVTSYYSRSWGFCMSEAEKASLPPGDYRAFIDSELFDGEMLYADAFFPGKTHREVFFSSYMHVTHFAQSSAVEELPITCRWTAYNLFKVVA